MKQLFFVFMPILMISNLEVAEGIYKSVLDPSSSQRDYRQSYESFGPSLSNIDPETFCSEIFSAEHQNITNPKCFVQILNDKYISIIDMEELPEEPLKTPIINCTCSLDSESSDEDSFQIIPDGEGKLIFPLKEYNNDEYIITGHWIRNVILLKNE